MTYNEAFAQLEKIADQVESNELDIDELSQKLEEAQKLITFCRKKLLSADEDIQKMLEGE